MTKLKAVKSQKKVKKDLDDQRNSVDRPRSPSMLRAEFRWSSAKGFIGDTPIRQYVNTPIRRISAA
ncbi:MAG: hypothetical protein ABR512_02540 [Desulfopila sp.]